jgi:hypothetical protein
MENRILCTACVERMLQTGDDDPVQKRTFSRQAVFGLVGGIGTWVLTAAMIGSAVVSQTLHTPGSEAVVGLLMLLAVGLFGAAVVIAFVGLGLSAAALRMRGDSVILAMLGLLLNGLHIGAMVGLMLFSIWLH